MNCNRSSFASTSTLILSLAFIWLLSSAPAAFSLPTCEGNILSESSDDYSFSSKLSILEFDTTVSYVEEPAGTAPFLKILSASKEVTVYTDESGVLTIAPADSTCGETVVDITSTAGSSPSSASSIMMASGLIRTFASRSLLTLPSIALATSFLLSAVSGEAAPNGCKPSLSVEIHMPAEAIATEKFGDTDHYLAATVDTVTWGYYDPEATPKITMESGETITVEVITHHSGHDYAKMIRGDPAVEEIFYWEANQTLLTKNEPKLPGSGVHLVTGPIEVSGAMPGDVIQVDILELDPRPNPETGKTYGTNSQKFAGYQYRIGEKRDGTPYVRTGGTEAITVFEFVEDDEGNMLYGKPVYMYAFPNMTLPDGSLHTFDSNPSVMVPHEFNMGYDGVPMEPDPIIYPPGFDDTTVIDEGGIKYLSPDDAKLAWKVPLRPHLGVLAVMPSNSANYIDEAATGGASTIPPARFGGNIDDYRIGKGGTMYYKVEVPGANIVVGDTHAAQGDSELAGTAMETSMTTKLRITLHKADSLPQKVATLDFPLLETKDTFVVHGFAYANYLDDLEDASTIFAEGASLDLAMADCFVRVRDWLMDVYDLLEEETIALMTTSINFGITQVVDGNWGVHAEIPKWVFDTSDTPYDYTCTTQKTPGRRLKKDDRRSLLEQHGVKESPDDYSARLFATVAAKCQTCGPVHHHRSLAAKFLDAKLKFANDRMLATNGRPILEKMRPLK